MKRFLKSIESKNLIKLIQNERGKQSDKDMIEKAEEIIIMGFGFDRDNLNILGFPEEIKNYPRLFKGKHIKYLDYKGRMNNLYSEFTSATQSKYFKVTRSISDSISDAFRNDFSIYLFK